MKASGLKIRSTNNFALFGQLPGQRLSMFLTEASRPGGGRA